MFFRLVTSVGQRKKNLNPYEESNLRPSDSELRCSATEPQRLHGVRGLLRSNIPFHYVHLPSRLRSVQVSMRHIITFPANKNLLTRVRLPENECIFHVTRVQSCNTSENYKSGLIWLAAMMKVIEKGMGKWEEINESQCKKNSQQAEESKRWTLRYHQSHRT